MPHQLLYLCLFRVHCGDADGMVSGAIHTTAATVRPAMQVLKGNSTRVSSVFFMCLSDRVLVYGECIARDDMICIIARLLNCLRKRHSYPLVVTLTYLEYLAMQIRRRLCCEHEPHC